MKKVPPGAQQTGVVFPLSTCEILLNFSMPQFPHL